MLNLTDWANTHRIKETTPEEVLTYLNDRGMNPGEVSKFEIGFVRRFSELNGNSPDIKLWNKTFCAHSSEEMGDNSSPKYRSFNKLIFPIHDDLGRVVSMVTRSLKSKSYINFLPEEAVHKGIFWGWKQALPHIWGTQRVLIAEGVFDLTAASKFFPASLSPLTCRLTEGQFQKICRYVKSVVLAYDMDDPGRKACDFWSYRFDQVGIRAEVLEYPFHDLNDWFLRDPVGMDRALSKLR